MFSFRCHVLTSDSTGISHGIPEDTQILITHTPPQGILDRTRKGKLAGCEVLGRRMSLLKTCRLHVFGHIHEAFGALEDTSSQTTRVSVNAAYPARKSPVVVDLKNW